jgi:hypothetical protein
MIAVSSLAAIPLRKEPNDVSEMTSQILFGESMDVLESREKWCMVRLHHDGYEGWVSSKQLDFNDQLPPVQSVFRASSLQISPKLIPAGAFIRDNSTLNTNEDGSLEAYAMMFLDAPYLWGGRTILGIDCSGFTQLVFRLAGLSIRRDAWQQAGEGEEVSFIEECRTGDLAFFDNAEGRIIHVGIVLRPDGTFPPTIIHASGKVRIDALDHQGIYNKESGAYSHNLRMIRRFPITQ